MNCFSKEYKARASCDVGHIEVGPGGDGGRDVGSLIINLLWGGVTGGVVVGEMRPFLPFSGDSPGDGGGVNAEKGRLARASSPRQTTEIRNVADMVSAVGDPI